MRLMKKPGQSSRRRGKRIGGSRYARSSATFVALKIPSSGSPRCAGSWRSPGQMLRITSAALTAQLLLAELKRVMRRHPECVPAVLGEL